MIDHTDDGIRASIKALDEVVAPAVDTSNPLAVEQLRLVSRFLGFLRTRLPHEHARAIHELNHYLVLAQKLVPLAPDESDVSARELLASAIDMGSQVAGNPSANAQQLSTATKELSAALSTLVRSVATAPEAVRMPIERAVVQATRSLLDAQRAWFLPMGFEPDSRCVPEIQDALAPAP